MPSTRRYREDIVKRPRLERETDAEIAALVTRLENPENQAVAV